MVNVLKFHALKFWTKWHMQTVQNKFRGSTLFVSTLSILTLSPRVSDMDSSISDTSIVANRGFIHKSITEWQTV